MVILFLEMIKINIILKNLKKLLINRVLIKKESLRFVAVELGLSSIGILHNWIKKYKENCYNVIEKKKGRKSKTMTKIKKTKKTLTKEDKIKELENKICIDKLKMNI